MIACHVIWYPGFVHWQFVFNIGSCYGVSLSLWRHSNSLKFRKNGILRLNQFYLKTALMILMKLGMDFRWGRANFWWRHSLRENSHCDVIMGRKLAKFYPEVGQGRMIPHMKALCRLISDLVLFSHYDVIMWRHRRKRTQKWRFLRFWPGPLILSNDCLPCNMVP